jgi:hypothetical protein
MKLMPSAAELRELCSIDDFIDKIITLVRSEAVHGESRYVVDIPLKHSESKIPIFFNPSSFLLDLTAVFNY